MRFEFADVFRTGFRSDETPVHFQFLNTQRKDDQKIVSDRSRRSWQEFVATSGKDPNSHLNFENWTWQNVTFLCGAGGFSMQSPGLHVEIVKASQTVLPNFEWSVQSFCQSRSVMMLLFSLYLALELAFSSQPIVRKMFGPCKFFRIYKSPPPSEKDLRLVPI